MKTLGPGIYFTNKKDIAVNYGFARTGHQEGVSFSVYTARMKTGRNFIADLNDPYKVKATYPKLLEHLKNMPKNDMSEPLRGRISGIINYLEYVIQNGYTFQNIRHFSGPKNHPALGKWNQFRVNSTHAMYLINYFIRSLGYHGLRCMEGGESWPSLYDWKPFLTYVIFDPNDIEVISEEHFIVRGGKLLKIQ